MSAIVALGAACLLLATPLSRAQDSADAEAERLAAGIAERRDAVRADATLSEATKANALEALDMAEGFLERAANDRNLARETREQRQAAPTLIAEAKDALAQPEQEPDPSAIAVLSDSELEIRIAEAETASQAASERHRGLQKDLNDLRARRPTIGSDLAKVREELRSVEDTIAQIKVAAETQPGTGTRMLRSEAEEQALLARIELLEARRNGIDVREELLLVQSKLAERDGERNEKHARSLRATQAQRQSAELASERTGVEDQLLYDRYPQLQALSESNEKLAREQSKPGSPRNITATRRDELAAIDKKIAYLDAEREQLDTMLDSLGRTTAAEQLIADALRSLSDFEVAPSAAHSTRDEIARRQAEVVRAKREQGKLERDLAGEVDRFLNQLPEIRSEDEAEVRDRVEALLAERLKLLQQVARDIDGYLDVLTQLRARQDSLATKSRDYRNYLQSRQVWVPNVAPVTTIELLDSLSGLRTIYSAELWRGALGRIGQWASDHWVAAMLHLGLAIITILMVLRARAASPRRIELARSSDGFARLANAVLPAVVFSAGLAIVLILTGSALRAVVTAYPAPPLGLQALAQVLPIVALSVFAIPLIRILFAPAGPVVQFQPERAREAAVIFKSISRIVLVPILIVGVFILMAAHLNKIGENAGAAARLLLIVAFLVVGSATHVVLNPKTGLLARPVESAAIGPAWRELVVYLVAMAIPALMILAVLAGYALGPYEATRALIGTAGIASLYLAAQSVLRGPSSVQPATGQLDSGADLSRGRNRLAMMLTTIFLIGVFAWVWDTVLQSLSYLQSITLWLAETHDGVEAVTVADLLWFILVLGGSLLAFWALPVVFGTRSLDPTTKGIGPRYAVVTLVRYTVLIVGVLAAFSALNIGWSRLQWMAAGLSVGLGFGLQESVANFIAGLMLLTEQQVRIGDVISVGDKMGTVTRIKVRATTVRDFDGRELIIPNKELVTTQVVNYTLSDTRRRIQVVVGVAYGSETDLVTQLMLQQAKQNPWVLDVPEPMVVFEQFAPDALQFRLYAWVDSGAVFLQTRDALHRGIDRSFRDNDVTIAFPQLDVHLVSEGPVPAKTPQQSPDKQ